MVQVFSLRHDFPNEFHKLLYSALNTQLTLGITEAHFPLFLSYLQGYKLAVKQAVLVLQTSAKQEISGFKIKLRSTEQASFTRDSQFGNLWSKDLGTLFSQGIMDKHTVEITNAGNLAPTAVAGGVSTTAIEAKKLTDIFLAVTYTLEKGI
jgi:hypothetical protein